MKPNRVITVGAGCFWCVQAVFQRVKGVHSATSGYMGGAKETANYKAVCRGDTEHVQVVRVEYDDSAISTSSSLLIRYSKSLLQHPRPHYLGPTGRRRGSPVQIDRLLPGRGPAEGVRGGATRSAEGAEGEDRDDGGAREGVLPRRGLPSELLQRQRRQEPILQHHPWKDRQDQKTVQGLYLIIIPLCLLGLTPHRDSRPSTSSLCSLPGTLYPSPPPTFTSRHFLQSREVDLFCSNTLGRTVRRCLISFWGR